MSKDSRKSTSNFIAQKERKSARFIHGLTITKKTLSVVSTVGDAVSPFLPAISTICTLIEQIVQIYENAQCYKKVCNTLVDRALMAELAISGLLRRKKENEENFRKQGFYIAFEKFAVVMEKIRDFAIDVSQISGVRKYVEANSVQERFKLLTSEFEECMKDLHFTLAVESEEQRIIDQRSLKEDVNYIMEYLRKINDAHYKDMALLHQEILSIKSQTNVKLKEIDSKQLSDPLIGKSDDRRGSVIKKLLRRTFDVACKPIVLQKSGKSNVNLAILEKVSDSPNILRFYGLSIVDNHEVMIFEWAELGNLKEVYEKHDIPWPRKVQMALDICRGIAFLHEVGVFHHDIRCQNVMITRNLESKLFNFELSREVNAHSVDITDKFMSCLFWMAPEKLNRDNPYNHKCEIFSFGMLLWELCFEKVPYKGKTTEYVGKHILNGGREVLKFNYRKGDDVIEIQKEFAKIIKQAWAQDPNERISLPLLFLSLETLCAKYAKPESLCGLLPDKSLVYDEDDDDFDCMTEFEDLTNEIDAPITLDEGIELHMKRDDESRKKAWECFSKHADLGNPKAKYWKGYYLWQGYCVEKDMVKAQMLFKESADEGIVDGQLRYAFAIFKKTMDPAGKKEFVEYLQRAANNGNAAAAFQMAMLYFHRSKSIDSSEFVEKDSELGIKYLSIAARNKFAKAIEEMRNMGLDI
ncbi:5460_t:CDS:2 [Acaulospora morrowiae]|uniref:5460_t:CDS:1 n=1 Tax=Acaulospora morrowiae TaxID=94023 RepID=A0A9N9AK18_9GLOM|nr:5460_t:CDS:2 [Acaulospora morrowiae]